VREAFPFLLGGTLVLGVLSGCGALRLRGEGELDRRGVYHVIRPGESLYRIARTYGVEVEDLAKVNHLSDPSKIRAGTRLFIPGAQKALSVPVRPSPEASADVKARPALPGELDFEWPLRGRITSFFGPRGLQMHQGVDIAAPAGTPIRAAEAGEVVFSGTGPGGYGLMIILRHAHGFHTLYAHNRRNLVRVGQQVRQGQVIGLVGSTGRSTGSHLHFEIRNRTSPRDPFFFLP
jgi:murein DD-endopeptidase MepM/ murein hydrolase activator NlpD